MYPGFKDIMHAVRTGKTGTVMSRILMGTAGLFLAAWGVAVIVDYILPGTLWRVFALSGLILLCIFGKAVYDGRLR